MGGFSYMEFIVPGLIMMSVITNSYSNVASSFYSTKFQKSIEELLVAPVPNYIIVLGYMGGASQRAALVATAIPASWLALATVTLTYAASAPTPATGQQGQRADYFRYSAELFLRLAS